MRKRSPKSESTEFRKMDLKTRVGDLPYEVGALRDMKSSCILMNMSRNQLDKRKIRILHLEEILQEKKFGKKEVDTCIKS